MVNFIFWLALGFLIAFFLYEIVDWMEDVERRLSMLETYRQDSLRMMYAMYDIVKDLKQYEEFKEANKETNKETNLE